MKLPIEMSDYIDLEKYDAFESTHPFYEEMTTEIISQVQRFKHPQRETKVLEIGAGTGLLTEKLIELPDLCIDALDIDINCCSFLFSKCNSTITKKNNNTTVNVIVGDGVTYKREGFYDIIVSSFSHDHIQYEKRGDFAENIRRNLTQNGIYIVGTELLPQFSTEEERKKALRKYHGYIIWKAIQDGYEQVAGLELESLISGLHMKGDFKQHPKMFEEEMISAGFNILSSQKIGPLDKENVGGIYVYLFQKINNTYS